ncbi:MAG: cold shock protein [Acidimicrobiaceae bacterium]|jgi:CspA family cold shock protein|nr:cold shock protein [Acidimicrobiaceae bacterium]
MRPIPRRGEVEEFDGVVGLGTIRDERGQIYSFHCTQIADGSRSVADGARVEFDIVPGHLGRWEAAGLRPC